MAHFVFSPLGSAGDVHPLLGIAIELQKRQHRVTFITHGYFRELVQRHGLSMVELGTREEFLASINHPDLWHPIRAFPYVFRNAIDPVFRRQYSVLTELFQSGELVAISSCLGFGALAAQEKWGLPVVTAHLQPAVIWSRIAPPTVAGSFGPRWLKNFQLAIGERFVLDRTVCPKLNRFRGELGLPPVRRVMHWWHSPQMVLCLFPEWYAPPQADWPPHVRQTDFPLWDEPSETGLPAEVRQFLNAGEPPIVFTPGSANRFGGPFLQAAVEACRTLGRRGMLLTRFPEQVPVHLPEGVKHFDYVPLSELLPHVVALAHHGGIGTTAQALQAGKPQLIMPLAHDQLDNAARVRRFGVGESLSRTRFRGPNVAAALSRLLDSATIQQTCRDVAGKFSPQGGVAMAADALEKFAEQVRTKEPRR